MKQIWKFFTGLAVTVLTRVVLISLLAMMASWGIITPELLEYIMPLVVT